MLGTPNRPFVLGFGFGALDEYPPPGVTFSNYAPGEKRRFTEADLIEYLCMRDKHPVEEHLGGSAVNQLAYLKDEYDTGLYTEIGNCPTSQEIRKRLAIQGITLYGAVNIKNHQPSSNIVTRGVDSCEDNPKKSIIIDREIVFKPRSPAGRHFKKENASDIKQACQDAEAIIVSSLKSLEANETVLAVASTLPQEPVIATTFSSETADYPEELRELCMSLRAADAPRIDLFCANRVELQALYPNFDLGNRKELRMAARIASKELAQVVMCTLGSEGVLMAENNRTYIAPVPGNFDASCIIDTTGAGDRGSAIALKGILTKTRMQTIGHEIVRGTLPVITTVGAHGDIEKAM